MYVYKNNRYLDALGILCRYIQASDRHSGEAAKRTKQGGEEKGKEEKDGISERRAHIHERV